MVIIAALLTKTRTEYTTLTVLQKTRDTKPILAINYKVYETSFGEKALAIALTADKIQEEYRNEITIILAVPFTEITRIVEATELVKIYAQHVDPIDPGPYTGYTPLEAIKEAGAKGTIINHSEHRIKISDIDIIIKKAHRLGLETLACADTPTVAAAIATLSPTAIAIEPPELIGTGTPVSKAKPEIITNTIRIAKLLAPDIPILAGAGITTGEDAEAAIKLGTQGILVSSTIMKSSNPEEKIRELTEALTNTWKTIKQT